MPATACTHTAGSRQRKRGPGSCSSAAPVLRKAPIDSAST
ncbi:hypothetical protein CIB84_015852 [Bambusicola thoracicus]|uniref:Uncharacterized protein n=1 Tax=Bambusicola thoracicus TaxID=9083 RepID=A0A2P4S8G2_BAMTH|nr:hypothetical protein CIB84_015852 [Bambusicola thoracicus]